MDNLLVKTLNFSFESGEKQKSEKTISRPFITISREFGCQANLLSEYLIAEILKRGHHWQMINKEIMNSAANELKLDPEKIRSVILAEKRNLFDEILDATSVKYYKSDRKIRQTIANIVTSFAMKGNIIIIGRAGSVITQGIPNALHIRLTAPVSWRLENIMLRYNLKREEAMQQLTKTDLKRHKLHRDFLKGSTDFDGLFDIRVNCSKVSHEEIVQIVISLLVKRGMI
ncbi:MAG: cytidylate kinase-like family protein [Lentimicrobium sp.]|nr:cytidylate kinase-like family protein [Lentimicrobium sp.]